MKPFVVSPCTSLKGTIHLPGDKSIAHRAIILSALSATPTYIRNIPHNDDCRATISICKQLGVSIKQRGQVLIVAGKGLRGLRRPRTCLCAHESGTTFRLMLGVLAGQDFSCTLCADTGLSKRPMRRVTEPLRMMGAALEARRASSGAGRIEEYPPVRITGSHIYPIAYRMPVASAQVKSAILLAGLFTDGKTAVIEPTVTRDHTERMMSSFGVKVSRAGRKIILSGGKPLVSPRRINIPGDISSAAFFLILGAIVPKAQITIKRVCLNPSRVGVLRVLRRMGARIVVKKYACGGEPAGDITIESSRLKGAIVPQSETPGIIDELPILMVAASYAKGKTVFRGVGELRVKETDRIRSMLLNLRKMGASIKVRKASGTEIIEVIGTGRLKGARVSSFSDHRTAMSMAVAAAAAEGKSCIDDISCVKKSFPGFVHFLNSLKR